MSVRPRITAEDLWRLGEGDTRRELVDGEGIEDPERVRAPGVAFIIAGRLPDGRLPQGFVRGAPDLAVEVLSSSDNPIDVQQKVRDWLEGGARLVWVIAPQAATATVYGTDGSARLLREHEVLDGEDVLPGLSIPLLEVFGG